MEDAKAGGCLGHSDHKMAEGWTLAGVRRRVSRAAALDFWRTDLGPFRRLGDGVPWEAALRESEKAGCSSRRNSFEFHSDPHESRGLDRIHPTVLRKLVEGLTKPLPLVYRQSWLTGEVPSAGD